jgi:hypothetical protein
MNRTFWLRPWRCQAHVEPGVASLRRRSFARRTSRAGRARAAGRRPPRARTRRLHLRPARAERSPSRPRSSGGRSPSRRGVRVLDRHLIQPDHRAKRAADQMQLVLDDERSGGNSGRSAASSLRPDARPGHRSRLASNRVDVASEQQPGVADPRQRRQTCPPSRSESRAARR